MRLASFFKAAERSEATHTWTLVSHDPEISPLDALAKALAERIMEHQCRGCPQHFQAWKQRLDGGTPLPSTTAAALKAFVGAGFGLPAEPSSVPLDHLEGFVGQSLWYFLWTEYETEGVVRIDPPGFKVTDPGGDGLIIHRVPDGYLMFRLWEIKKCTGNSEVSSTISTAYDQLNERATEYLARYTAIGQVIDDAELAMFYSQLIDLWIEARPEAAAGVAVATSLDRVPIQCFSTFGQRFPAFVNPVRLRGMLTAIGDFSAFALKVRDYIWTGL